MEPPGRLSLTARLQRRAAGLLAVPANARLTSLTGALLLVLLVLQVLSALLFALLSLNVVLPAAPIFDVVQPVHFFVGFLLMPLIVIKLASVGYRFGAYYLRDAEYHEAGPPPWLARLLAPLLVASAVVLFGSGVEMWSFRNDLIGYWTQVHVLSAVAFTGALVLHVAMRGPRAYREAATDLRASPDGAEAVRGGVTRRSVLTAGAVVGLGVAVSTANWPLSSLSWLYPRKVGDGPLDFPVMNYEGGGQRVDLAAWRLRVTGAVSRPLTLDGQQLAALPSEEHRYPIKCVTGWQATRTWRGVPVSRILQMAGADPGFGHVQVRSTSGYHWDHERDRVLLQGALLVTHVDGVPLDQAHGAPLRLMIPGVEGQANVKWVDGLTVGLGSPEIYVSPNVVPRPQAVSGPLLPPDPAGHP